MSSQVMKLSLNLVDYTCCWERKASQSVEAGDLGLAVGQWPEVLAFADAKFKRGQEVLEGGRLVAFIYVAPGRTLTVLND